MRKFVLPCLCGFVLAGAVLAQAQPHPTKVTFYISNVQSSDDVTLITEAVKKVATVTDVNGLTATSGFAVIGFDSHAVSFHQVAQAITDAGAAKNKKLEPIVKFTVPEYSQGENAAKVDEVFKKVENLVKIETLDKEKGLFAVHFLPLKVEDGKQGPQGFNGGKLGHPIHDPADKKGLGLKFSFVQEKVK